MPASTVSKRDQSQHWAYPGARWWKFDFHTHTPASNDYGKGPEQATLKNITPKEWLLGFMRAEVDCVAVTDHNSGEWIDRLKQSLHDLEQEGHAEFRPMYLFPGVEVTANNNIHILAVFGAEKTSSNVAKLLGAVGYEGASGASDVAANSAPIGVVEAIRKAGGIPILAHVDGPSGAWKLAGNTLAPLLDLDALYAIEVVHARGEKPELYSQRKLAWAEILGSDSHHPSGSAGHRFPGSHYTWVKMAQPSLEGFRLALLDGGGFSIRRSDESESFDPFSLPKYCIEGIDVGDARYMGRGQPSSLKFSPWLNALVGGRGTGKSTVIHALRLAARRNDELTNLEEHSGTRLTFERFNRVPSNRMDEGGLTETTKILWNLVRDGVRHRVHWRQDGAGIIVEDESSEDSWVPSPAQTFTPDRFPVRMFNQGQIAELAGSNQQALLRVIDEAAGVTALQQALEEARNTFYASEFLVRDLERKLAGRDKLVVEQQDVERKLKRFEDAGHSAILTTYRLRNRQRKEVGRQLDGAEDAAERITQAADALLSEDIPEGLFGTESKEDREAAAIVEALAAAVRAAGQELRGSAQRLRGFAEKQRETLTKSAWQTAVEQATGNYEKLVEALKAEGVSDPNEYGRLVQERQRLEGEMKTLKSIKEKQERTYEQSRERLKKVDEARRAISIARNKFLTTALARNNFVRIEIRRYGKDPRVIERSLREALKDNEHFQRDVLVMDGDQPIKGCVAELHTDLPEGSEKRNSEFESRIARLKDRITKACHEEGDFGGHFNNYLERQFQQGPEFLDKLLTWFPEDWLSVEYSRAGDGTDFRPISQGSAGQRSAAMLAFLLAHGEEPLVLDQPEDDLDNHLIYDLVVRQIRENKHRRQIVVVTHNPNIVVNGDAEMLHVLDFQGGQCVVAQSGSLQEEAMREAVCRVLEGGREAFERRYRRLGPEPAGV